MGPPEGIFDEVVLLVFGSFADDPQPLTASQRAVFVESFIYHVPPLDAAFVAADNGRDVVFHASQEGITRQGISRIVAKNPRWNLAVPNEAMADDDHLVLLTKGHVSVGRLPVVLVEPRMDTLPLQIVFSSCRAEVLLGDRGRILGPALLRRFYSKPRQSGSDS